ncbi:MAG: 6-carboxytetrahydropterin synthase [Thermodesulfobacteriota bacterium]|nr:6-carboxytetrahydropterin synthase [Thermodesulfobacteriota bacterium]
MFEVGVVSEFEAQHHLRGDFGDASRPHRHEYKAEVKISGDMLDEWGMLFDIGVLQEKLIEVCTSLFHRNLNEMGVFMHENPTAENLSKYIFIQIFPIISGKESLRMKVTVWESENAFASYGTLDKPFL